MAALLLGRGLELGKGMGGCSGVLKPPRAAVSAELIGSSINGATVSTFSGTVGGLPPAANRASATTEGRLSGHTTTLDGVGNDNGFADKAMVLGRRMPRMPSNESDRPETVLSAPAVLDAHPICVQEGCEYGLGMLWFCGVYVRRRRKTRDGRKKQK
jgi:hypothetical protein